MGKRLVCPACRSENVYDEPIAFMNVRCKACGRTFYAEANLFVTEVPPVPRPSVPPGVKLVCTYCHVENTYDYYDPSTSVGDIHRHGGAARCKACGQIFNVPPPGDKLGPSGAHGMKHDRTVAYAHAQGRLREHVSKHPRSDRDTDQYLDRDRDLLLLQLIERVDELHEKIDRTERDLAQLIKALS